MMVTHAKMRLLSHDYRYSAEKTTCDALEATDSWKKLKAGLKSFSLEFATPHPMTTHWLADMEDEELKTISGKVNSVVMRKAGSGVVRMDAPSGFHLGTCLGARAVELRINFSAQRPAKCYFLWP
ncbi:uncharacterized protein L3040_008500 [Drepanopeziza brunnea f. sp. 'multigermtubi']|uniref:uncharacterized protein n=1 Tax=Drepanopeziza brunnea f. sp. 'multigermtubi' TaxID=698441 RepID=UPI002393BA1A|nr:hypothetical protein L3040_008500 [Drepanopeziza brunnea f. sp. 'multigermtubi']